MQFQIKVAQMDSPQALFLVKNALAKRFNAVDATESSNVVNFENQADLETTRLTLDEIFEESLKPAGIEYDELIKIDF